MLEFMVLEEVSMGENDSPMDERETSRQRLGRLLAEASRMEQSSSRHDTNHPDCITYLNLNIEIRELRDESPGYHRDSVYRD